MDSANLDQPQLDRIAEEFSDAIRRGQRPSIDDYLTRYPDPSGQLRKLLGSIAMIEGLKQASGLDTARHAEPLQIQELDDYTIVREIGRGGMGVVFEAIHQSLGRRVAVKVLASGLLGNTKHLTRFKREARAAARLRHPNIVPVFGVGESGGHHYYVMDFIDGMSLRQWLSSITASGSQHLPTREIAAAETDGDLNIETVPIGKISIPTSDVDVLPVPDRIDSPDYFRWVAQIGMTICDALHYAHSQGILHRDIKPGNVLVDRQGTPWIADFGLAKLTEQQAMTMTGDIIGTPQYMAPESFEGTFDVKSEIYCVGLTLYELLTRRPAIEGKNAGDLIRKASAGISVSPRKLNQRVPRDLETIVLKSLLHDPRSRYLSASEFRDDLRRFLSDRPISARRTGLVERAVRWTRREPAVATLTFSTFVLLLALAAVAAIGYFRTKDALSTAQSAKNSAEQSLQQRTVALQVADEQRVRAEKNLQVAVAAFDTVMENITDRAIEPDAEFLGEISDTTSPNVTPDDAKLLQSLLGFFDQLAANNSEDLRAASADAGRRAGDIYRRLGRLHDADRAYSDALRRYRELLEQNPGEVSFVMDQVAVMNELAVIAGLRGHIGRANDLFDQTLALLKDSDAMKTQTGRFEYARAHRLFASLGARTGMDGIFFYPPDRITIPSRPMTAMMKVRTTEELNAVAEAIDVLNKLIEEAPSEIRFKAELARVFRDKAKVASRARLRSESESAVRESIDLFEQLLQEHGDSDAIRYELAKTLSSTEALGLNQMLRGIQANELSTALLEKSPTLQRYQALQAHTLETLAWQQQRMGNFESAERNLLDALAIYQSLTIASPELSVYPTRKAQTLESIADLKLRQGETETAIEYLERAIRRLQPGMRGPDASPVARMQLQRMKLKLGRIKS